MESRLVYVCILVVMAAMVIGNGTPVCGQEPDWQAMGYTTHRAFQAVDVSGAGTFATNSPIKMKGLILNRPSDMLNAEAGFDTFMGGQWQMFIQAVEPADFGGTALYMGQNIGKPSGNHPAGSYTDVEWMAELERLSRDPATGRPFRSGDLVEVRARAPGLFFRGKTNINEQHQKVADADFDIVLLTPNHSNPSPQTIALNDVKDTNDQFIFDSSRQTGAEHYQGAFVRFENVQFTSGTWGPNQQMMISDGAGRTLPVLLGLGGGFTRFEAPAAPFDIVGVFNQEDANAADGFKHGYVLWVMDYDGTEFVLYRYVKPDFDRDGDVDADDVAHFMSCASGPAVPQADPNCLTADFDGDSDVDQDDIAVLQRCLSDADHVPDPACDD